MISTLPALVGPDLTSGARQGVYFVKPVGRPFIKIGHGCPIPSRLRDIQCGCPEALEILLLVRGGRKLEGLIHRALSGYGYRGEWFNDCPPVRELMRDLIACDGDFAAEARASWDRRKAAFMQRLNNNRRLAEEALAADMLIATVLPLSSAGAAA